MYNIFTLKNCLYGDMICIQKGTYVKHILRFGVF